MLILCRKSYIIAVTKTDESVALREPERVETRRLLIQSPIPSELKI